MSTLSKMLVLVIAIPLYGCNEIKILGLKQDGSKECPDGERVYLYRDAKVGICLNEEVVIFTHCVSELAVGTTNIESSENFGIKLSGLHDTLTSAKASSEQKQQVIKEFASGGELEKARADAIRGCMRLAHIPMSDK